MHLIFLIWGNIITIPFVRLEKITVKVTQGILRGNKESTVFGNRLYYSFYGVPYAEPPIRQLRFKDPKTNKKWKSDFDARQKYSGACAQGHIVHRRGTYGVEDCLHLNIYTPQLPKYSTDEMKPVIVWFHGYAFSSSFSHLFGPDFFIDNDILFVSVNYRIGPLGFLKINDKHNGNMGLRDIVMSLKYVRRNIKKFGGDKTKVTVMGFDSAGTMLSLLLTSNTNLFSKIIIHSGSMFSSSIFQGNPMFEREQLVNELGKINKDIYTALPNELIDAGHKIYTSKDMLNFQRQVVPFTPIIIHNDNASSIFYKPNNAVLSKLNKNIPMLIGFNSQESISEIIPFLNNPLLLKSFENNFKFMVPFSDGCFYNYTSNIYSKVAKIIEEYYFKRKINKVSLKQFMKYTTELHIYQIYHFIKKYSAVKQNTTFAYKFNYRGQLNSVMRTATQGISFPIKGTAKGDELCYLLKCEPLYQTYTLMHKDVHESQDKILIKEISTLWANFVKDGNPTPDGYFNYTWTPLSNINNKILLIDKVRKMVTPHREILMYKFWKALYHKYYHKRHCSKRNHDEF